jgi:hypothetical protein
MEYGGASNIESTDGQLLNESKEKERFMVHFLAFAAPCSFLPDASLTCSLPCLRQHL